MGKERLFYILMTVLVAIEIFFWSSISSVPAPETGLINLALIYHSGIFFAFTFFLTLSIKSKKLNLKQTTIILLLTFIYALSDEFHQLFVIGRFASIKDVLVDMTGAVFSIILIKAIELLKNKSPSTKLSKKGLSGLPLTDNNDLIRKKSLLL